MHVASSVFTSRPNTSRGLSCLGQMAAPGRHNSGWARAPKCPEISTRGHSCPRASTVWSQGLTRNNISRQNLSLRAPCDPRGQGSGGGKTDILKLGVIALSSVQPSWSSVILPHLSCSSGIPMSQARPVSDEETSDVRLLVRRSLNQKEGLLSRSGFPFTCLYLWQKCHEETENGEAGTGQGYSCLKPRLRQRGSSKVDLASFRHGWIQEVMLYDQISVSPSFSLHLFLRLSLCLCLHSLSHIDLCLPSPHHHHHHHHHGPASL